MLPALLAMSLLSAPDVRVERWPDGSPRAEYEVRVEADGRELRHGSWKSWHENGKEHESGAFADGQASGEWLVRWPNGKRRAQGSFAAGLREGEWKEYHESGPKAAEGRYAAGRRSGPWTFWGADRKVDPSRSGTYAPVARAVGAAGATVEGATLDGRPFDLWIWRRAGGGLLLAGRFGPDGPEGPWVAVFADGTPDPEGISGEYAAGVRIGALTGWPEGVEPIARDLAPDPRRAPALAVDARAAAGLEAWLAAEPGAREGPWRALAAEPWAAFAACVAWLQGVDFAAPDERARRVALEALPLLIGAAFPIEAGTPGERARLALAWRDHVELSDLDAKPWRALFDARWRGGEVELAHTPLAVRAAPREWLDATSAAATADPGRGRSGARFGGRRDAKARGGSGTEEAVDAGIAWLVRARAADGSWERGTPRTLEATSWALLALGGMGLDVHESDATNAAAAAAIQWLLAQQRPDSGRYATPLCYELRSHALALWALAETTGLQELPVLKASLARGTEALLVERTPAGGFPRDVGGQESDVLATLYGALALTVLDAEGLADVADERRRTLEHLASLLAADGALAEPEGRTPAATAAAAFLRLIDGRDPTGDAVLARQIAWMIAHPSNIEPRHPQLDAEYLMFGAWASIQVGGQVWTDWNTRMKTQLLQVQRREGDLAGSWETLGIGPMDVTTVTAKRVMTFQAYWRYRVRER